MSTIKKILVPVDFSDASAVADGRALEVAARVHAKILFLHVIDELPAMLLGSESPVPSAVREAHERRLRAELEASAMRAHVAQVSSKCLVLHGVPARTIVDVAEREDCDLIIMGTHGHTGARRFMLGSVAEEVVRTASVPVMTVHADAASARTPPKGLRIRSSVPETDAGTARNPHR